MSLEAIVVLLVVLFPFFWLLFSPGAGSPRLPPVAAPARPADPLDGVPALPVLHEGLAVRPERAAPALEALDGHAVVSLEPLAPRAVVRRTAKDAEPNRVEEHARFRRKVAAAPPADAASEAPFLDARELRRAMLMAEVLGPPRSLRPLGEDR